MEKIKKRCVHCRHFFVLCRNPEQSYCHQQICQNVRKRAWRRHKQANDPDYRENQLRANKTWQQHHADYWRSYRAAHTDYVRLNREQTRLRRQQKRQPKTDKASQFASNNELPQLNQIKPGRYRLISEVHSEFAKSDALLVTIACVSRG